MREISEIQNDGSGQATRRTMTRSLFTFVYPWTSTVKARDSLAIDPLVRPIRYTSNSPNDDQDLYDEDEKHPSTSDAPSSSKKARSHKSHNDNIITIKRATRGKNRKAGKLAILMKMPLDVFAEV